MDPWSRLSGVRRTELAPRAVACLALSVGRSARAPGGMCRHACRMEAGASAECAHVMCGRDAGVAACEHRSRCVEHGSRAVGASYEEFQSAGGSALASFCVRSSSVRLRSCDDLMIGCGNHAPR